MFDLKDKFGKLKNKMDEQNREIQKSKTEIESLKGKNTEKNVNLEENSNENIEELNAKILAIESDEWYKIKQWLHENNILDCNQQKKVGYYNFCDTLNESKRFDNELTSGQMIKAREIYMILEDLRYFSKEKEEKTKEEDVDEFFMQFMGEVKV